MVALLLAHYWRLRVEDFKSLRHMPEFPKTVNELLSSEEMREPTRLALERRLQEANGAQNFFSEKEFELLTAICDRLMNQTSKDRIVNPAVFIGNRLSKKKGDGWRYDVLPPDDEMYLQGIGGVDQTSQAAFCVNFVSLSASQQVEILTQIQQGNPQGEVWKSLRADKFFEELLAEVADVFFSHPEVQLQMKYKGMLDANGWDDLKIKEA